MYIYTSKNLFKVLRPVVSWLLCVSFSITTIIPPQAAYAQNFLSLPSPGTVVSLTPAYNPAIIRGITLYPDNPLKFDFIVDVGDDNLQGLVLKKESEKLIKYFLASLTVPEKEMWVNLSPYEKDRIIPQSFGKTEMGRDLLMQDYMLKQLTASLMVPENSLGEQFWQRVRAKVKEKFGDVNIPTDTFNKVWIIPDKADVFVNDHSIFVIESHLKVMLDEDYVAISSQPSAISSNQPTAQLKADSRKLTAPIKELLREIIIPEIEKEVNEGKTFAMLRQIYNSVILATWYKKNLQKSLLGQIYVDRSKTAGVENNDPQMKQKIYDQYLQAFKQGVYDVVKDDYDPATQEVISRKYFSGGAAFNKTPVKALTLPTPAKVLRFISRPHETETVNLAKLTKEETQADVPLADAAMLTLSKAFDAIREKPRAGNGQYFTQAADLLVAKMEETVRAQDRVELTGDQFRSLVEKALPHRAEGRELPLSPIFAKGWRVFLIKDSAYQQSEIQGSYFEYVELLEKAEGLDAGQNVLFFRAPDESGDIYKNFMKSIENYDDENWSPGDIIDLKAYFMEEIGHFVAWQSAVVGTTRTLEQTIQEKLSQKLPKGSAASATHEIIRMMFYGLWGATSVLEGTSKNARETAKKEYGAVVDDAYTAQFMYVFNQRPPSLDEDKALLALSTEEIRQYVEAVKATHPHWNWNKAAEVVNEELIRELIEGIQLRNTNEALSFKRSVLVRKDLLEILRDLATGNLKDAKTLSERFRTINRHYLLGLRGNEEILRTETTYSDMSDDFIRSIAGIFDRDEKENLAYFEEILKRLQTFLQFNANISKEDVGRFVAKFYEELIRSQNMFVKGNHSLYVNLMNTMLRLHGLNGVNHGWLDILIKSDSIDAAEYFYEEMILKRNPELAQPAKSTSAPARVADRPFGSTRFSFFPLGLGTLFYGHEWPVGDPNYVEPTQEEVDAHLLMAFEQMHNEQGIVMIDTAAAYKWGEEKIGRFFETHPELRSRAFIATKWGLGADFKETDYSMENLLDSFSRSVGHMGHVDLLYMHFPSVTTSESLEPLRESHRKIVDRMIRMKEQHEGELQLIGVTFTTPEQLEMAINEGLIKDFDVVQMYAKTFLERPDLIAKIQAMNDGKGKAIVLNSPYRKAADEDKEDAKELYQNILRQKGFSVLLTGTRHHLQETIGYLDEAMLTKVLRFDDKVKTLEIEEDGVIRKLNSMGGSGINAIFDLGDTVIRVMKNGGRYSEQHKFFIQSLSQGTDAHIPTFIRDGETEDGFYFTEMGKVSGVVLNEYLDRSLSREELDQIKQLLKWLIKNKLVVADGLFKQGQMMIGREGGSPLSKAYAVDIDLLGRTTRWSRSMLIESYLDDIQQRSRRKIDWTKLDPEKEIKKYLESLLQDPDSLGSDEDRAMLTINDKVFDILHRYFGIAGDITKADLVNIVERFKNDKKEFNDKRANDFTREIAKAVIEEEEIPEAVFGAEELLKEMKVAGVSLSSPADVTLLWRTNPDGKTLELVDARIDAGGTTINAARTFGLQDKGYAFTSLTGTGPIHDAWKGKLSNKNIVPFLIAMGLSDTKVNVRHIIDDPTEKDSLLFMNGKGEPISKIILEDFKKRTQEMIAGDRMPQLEWLMMTAGGGIVFEPGIESHEVYGSIIKMAHDAKKEVLIGFKETSTDSDMLAVLNVPRAEPQDILTPTVEEFIKMIKAVYLSEEGKVLAQEDEINIEEVKKLKRGNLLVATRFAEYAQKLIARFKLKGILINRDYQGMIFVLNDGQLIDGNGINVKQVSPTGARDAAAAGFLMALTNGKGYKKAVELANLFWAATVRLPGSEVATPEALPKIKEERDVGSFRRVLIHDLKNALMVLGGYAEMRSEEEELIAKEMAIEMMVKDIAERMMDLFSTLKNLEPSLEILAQRESIKRRVLRLTKIIKNKINPKGIELQFLGVQSRGILKNLKKIESFLNISIDGSLMKTKVDLNQIIEDIVDDYNLISRKTSDDNTKSKDVEFVLDLDQENELLREASIDQLGLSRVIQNLVVNAHFELPTNRKGRITIATQMIDQRQVKITVTDNGNGIAPERFEKIFEAGESTKGEQGSGLGLYSSRQIIEAHGGTIRVAESIPGERTTFEIIVPITEAHDEAMVTSEPEKFILNQIKEMKRVINSGSRDYQPLYDEIKWNLSMNLRSKLESAQKRYVNPDNPTAIIDLQAFMAMGLYMLDQMRQFPENPFSNNVFVELRELVNHYNEQKGDHSFFLEWIFLSVQSGFNADTKKELELTEQLLKLPSDIRDKIILLALMDLGWHIYSLGQNHIKADDVLVDLKKFKLLLKATSLISDTSQKQNIKLAIVRILVPAINRWFINSSIEDATFEQMIEEEKTKAEIIVALDSQFGLDQVISWIEEAKENDSKSKIPLIFMGNPLEMELGDAHEKIFNPWEEDSQYSLLLMNEQHAGQQKAVEYYSNAKEYLVNQRARLGAFLLYRPITRINQTRTQFLNHAKQIFNYPQSPYTFLPRENLNLITVNHDIDSQHRFSDFSVSYFDKSIKALGKKIRQVVISFYNQRTRKNDGDFILDYKDYLKFVRSHTIDPRIIPIKAVFFEDPTHTIVIIDDLTQDYFKGKEVEFRREDGFLVEMSIRFMTVSEAMQYPEKFKEAMTLKSDEAMVTSARDLVGGQLNDKYLERIREIINPQAQSPQKKVALYFGGAADVSTALRVTEASDLIIVDKNSFYSTSSNVQTTPELREQKIREYLAYKKDGGYGSYDHFEQMGIWLYLEAELKIMGAENIALENDDANPRHITINFKWQGQERTLHYVSETNIFDVDQYSQYLRQYGGVDYLILKASAYGASTLVLSQLLDRVIGEFLNLQGALISDGDHGFSFETTDEKVLSRIEDDDLENLEDQGATFGYGNRALIFQKHDAAMLTDRRHFTTNQHSEYYGPFVTTAVNVLKALEESIATPKEKRSSRNDELAARYKLPEFFHDKLHGIAQQMIDGNTPAAGRYVAGQGFSVEAIRNVANILTNRVDEFKNIRAEVDVHYEIAAQQGVALDQETSRWLKIAFAYLPMILDQVRSNDDLYKMLTHESDPYFTIVVMKWLGNMAEMSSEPVIQNKAKGFLEYFIKRYLKEHKDILDSYATLTLGKIKNAYKQHGQDHTRVYTMLTGAELLGYFIQKRAEKLGMDINVRGLLLTFAMVNSLQLEYRTQSDLVEPKFMAYLKMQGLFDNANGHSVFIETGFRATLNSVIKPILGRFGISQDFLMLTYDHDAKNPRFGEGLNEQSAWDSQEDRLGEFTMIFDDGFEASTTSPVRINENLQTVDLLPTSRPWMHKIIKKELEALANDTAMLAKKLYSRILSESIDFDELSDSMEAVYAELDRVKQEYKRNKTRKNFVRLKLVKKYTELVVNLFVNMEASYDRTPDFVDHDPEDDNALLGEEDQERISQAALKLVKEIRDQGIEFIFLSGGSAPLTQTLFESAWKRLDELEGISKPGPQLFKFEGALNYFYDRASWILKDGYWIPFMVSLEEEIISDVKGMTRETWQRIKTAKVMYLDDTAESGEKIQLANDFFESAGFTSLRLGVFWSADKALRGWQKIKGLSEKIYVGTNDDLSYRNFYNLAKDVSKYSSNDSRIMEQLTALRNRIAVTMASTQSPGGIDLNPNRINFKTHGMMEDLNIPFDASAFQNIEINGFYPVIINITPTSNLPLLLGMNDQPVSEPPLVSTKDPIYNREEVSSLR